MLQMNGKGTCNTYIWHIHHRYQHTYIHTHISIYILKKYNFNWWTVEQPSWNLWCRFSTPNKNYCIRFCTMVVKPNAKRNSCCLEIEKYHYLTVSRKTNDAFVRWEWCALRMECVVWFGFERRIMNGIIVLQQIYGASLSRHSKPYESTIHRQTDVCMLHT